MLVDTIYKEAYFESDYKEIINLISSFINRLPTISNYYHEYLELLKRIKSIKTIKEIKKTKLIKKYCLIGACCISFAIICIFLIINLIVPSTRYNNAIECIYNQEYNKAETIFKDLDGFKDSDLQLELIDVYKLLNNNQYVEAIELFEKKNGKVNIDYNPNGGEVQEKLRSLANSRFKTCSKKGYNFIKYEVENYEINTKKELVLDISLKAIYEMVEYQITYDLDKGTLENSNPLSYNIESDEIILCSPKKRGYAFVGWFNEDNENMLSIKKGSIGNIKLTAKYSPITYEIVYELNGGNNADDNVINYNIESDTIYLESPNKLGYSFKGWTIGDNQNLCKEYSILKGTIGNIKLTAHWEANEYNIIYELNGGANNPSNPDGYIHDNGDIKIYEACKEGYSFEGWSISKDIIPVKEYIIYDGTYGDVELIAIFKANKYNIIFDVNGGDEQFDDSMTVTFDSEYYLGKPTRIAYEFVSWNYNGSTFEQGGIYDIAGDITLTATWKPINYRITYELDNGVNSENNPIKYNIEESIKLSAPTKTGYSFIGWSTKYNSEPILDYTIPLNSYGDITIIANFEPKKFKITYNVNNGNQLSNNEQLVEYDSVFDTIIPTRVGYTFDCWNLNNKKFDMNEWNLLEDIELVAAWKANVYDVEIIDEVSNTFKVTYDSYFNIVNQLKDNYIFKGYYSEPYGKGSQYTDENGKSLNLYKDTNNLILYPYYQYNVEFVSNGGSEVDSIILDENQLISTEIVSEKQNRTFAGWYTDIYLLNNFNEVNGNIILYAKWQEESLINNFIFINENNNIYIKALNVIEKEVVFPTHIGGCLVVDISSSLFTENYVVEKIVFPNSIKKINTMSHCSVKEIVIPETVEEISDFNFNGLYSLTKVYILENSLLTNIGNYAFYNSGLKEINLPQSLKTIGNYAFHSCDLENINIPDGIISIGTYAFVGTNINNIIIPNSVENIGYGALEACNNLINIQIPFLGANLSDYEHKNIGYIFGVYNCYQFNTEIPDSLINVTLTKEIIIGSRSFYGCKNIETINLDCEVTTIKNGAFEGCSSLKEIEIPNSCIKIESAAFYGCVSLEKMILPFIGESRYSNTFLSFIFGASYATNTESCIISPLKEVIVTDVETIGDHAFYEFNTITKIILPNKVQSIGDYAFCNCSNLEEINIPSSCTSIGEDAFRSCINLKKIELPEKMNKIGAWAFVNCWSLESIRIPKGISSLSWCLFGNCYNLKNVEIPEEITSIDSYAFNYCTSLINIELPLDLTLIGDGAFENCTSLVNIIVPNNVQKIGFEVFSGCSSLQNISLPFIGETMDGDSNTNFGYIFGTKNSYYNTDFIPKNLEVTINGGTNIGNYSFYECNNIRKIVLPDTVTSINDYAFYNCLNLEEINIPSNVEFIGELAFLGCQLLVNIDVSLDNKYFKNINGNIFTLDEKVFVLYAKGKNDNKFDVPLGVEEIYGGAFSDCINLQTIIIPEGVVTIGNYAFRQCVKLSNVMLPISLNNIGADCFYACDSLEKILLPEKITYLGPGAFCRCNNLKEINLPNKIEVIGAYTFADCNSLENIIIPENIKSIEMEAFNGCVSLKTVYNFSDLKFHIGSSDYGKVAYYAENIYTTLE